MRETEALLLSISEELLSKSASPRPNWGEGGLTRQGSVRVLLSSKVQGEVPDMGQGAERRGPKRRWIQGSCPHTLTKGPSCRKKPRTRLPRALNPTAGQLPPATARGQMARRPEMAQNMNISEEWLLTRSRADCESWNVPRRTVLERDSRTSQVQGIMPRGVQCTDIFNHSLSIKKGLCFPYGILLWNM